MTRTRGPARYGRLSVDHPTQGVYQEDNIAWSWAKGLMRKWHPRCSFKQNRHAVVAFRHGEPVGVWLKDDEGEEVTL